MFNNMFGDLQKKQEDATKLLNEMKLEESVGDGSIKLVQNGHGEWLDLSINMDFLDLTSSDQLEDLMISLANKARQQSIQQQQNIQEDMMKDIMPNGMGLDALKDLL